MPIAIPPGVFDILPNDPKDPWCNSHIWSYVEDMVRKTAADYGFKEIRTPVFERTELFRRGVGETSDIVSKEMYTFEDRGGRSMTLRPEGTAPVMRAFIENQLANQSSIHKLFYIGPMFRYERSQAGRYRQHHQFGAEAIGIEKPEQDAEIIDLLYTLYGRLGLKNLEVDLNSIGDTACRITYRKALQEFLRSSLPNLSSDSQSRFETNPMRILDSKDLNDQAILKNAPSILDFLSDECRSHFDSVKKILEQLKIPFKINPKLVRGLDYYNKTVFEITSGELGAQNSVGGGGRYDGLLKTLEGPDFPAIGFGTGIERIIQTMLKQHVSVPSPSRPKIFFIPLGEEARTACLNILHHLRGSGIAADMDYTGRKVGKVMQYADSINAEYVAVVGDEELKSQQVELKKMATGEKLKAPLFHLTRILKIDLIEGNFLSMWEEMMKPFETKEEAEFFMQRIQGTIKETKQLTEKLQGAMAQMESLLE